jgi:hypothetical protein
MAHTPEKVALVRKTVKRPNLSRETEEDGKTLSRLGRGNSADTCPFFGLSASFIGVQAACTLMTQRQIGARHERLDSGPLV